MSFRIQYIATVLFFTELLFCLTVVPSVGADTQTESPSQNTLRYRFWMAPAEKIEQWPWDNQKYYPVHSDVFNQWVQQTQENNRSFQEEQPERQIREIHLTARLEGNCLIDGLGTFRTTPNVKTVTPLPLEPFSFYCPGILRPDGTWLYMGLYPDGKIYLTNPTGDTFTFPWTKQGKTAPNGDIIFDFDLVPSPVTELSLTVPRQYRLSSSTGILKSKNTKDDGFQEWQLNLGSNHHVRLTVSPDTPITDLQSRIGYRQKISYRFSLYGTEVVSHFTFSPTDKNLDDVIVILDQPLVPTAIEWGNGESGNTIFSCTNSLGTTRIRLRNPTPAQPAELKITGYCPLICDKEWRLPSVRILSDNLVWTETSANLLITEPLFVTELSPLESVQTFEPLYVHQENQNIYSFKYFQPNGGIAIKLQEKKSDVVFDSVTICSYNPVDVKARTTVFVRVTQTGQSQFSLPVTQNWSIDAVQIPTQEDFFWECTSPDIQGNKELKISMKTPVSQTDGLTLEINSRYSESLEKLEDVDHFSPIALGNILKGVHYLTFLTESPYKVSILTREGTPYTSPSQRILAGITGNEIKIRDLLASFTFNDIISLGEESVGCIARLEKKRSSCSTIIEGRISVQETSITESWKIKCTPLSGSRVDRLIVAFTDSEIPDSNEDSPENYLKTPWNWTLAFETDKSFSVEQLSEEEFKTLNLPSSMIAWEIQLLTSRSVPFEIRATRTTPLQRVRIVPLLFLPEMNNPQAEILVDSSTPTPVRLEAFQLSAITPELKKPGEYNRLIGCYQYIPDEFHHSPGQKLLLANDFFEPDTETDNEPLHKKSNSLNATDFFSSLKGWCWFTRCNTLYDANGFIRNHISLDMENHGLDSMTVTISDNVEPDSIYVWVNDKQINTHIINQRDIQIVLPEGNRFVHINIEYPLMENSLLQKNVLNDKIFTCNIPILSGTSNIWIPPTFTNNLTDESPLKQKLFREKIKTVFCRDKFPQAIINRFRTVSENFLSIFGNDTMMKALKKEREITSKKDIGKTESSRELSGTDTQSASTKSQNSVITWGEIFTDPVFVHKLFVSPETGNNNISALTFQIYIDRNRLSITGVNPITPITWSDALTVENKAINSLEQYDLILLFIDHDTLLVTTSQFFIDYGNDTAVSLKGNRFWAIQDRVVSQNLRKMITTQENDDFVDAAFWTAFTGSHNPWTQKTVIEKIPLGWNICPMVWNIIDSISIINKYQLISRQWILFLLILIITWEKPWVNLSVLVSLLGFFGMISCFSTGFFDHYIQGAFWGTFCSLSLYGLNYYTTSTRKILHSLELPSASLQESDEESDPGFVLQTQIPGKQNVSDSQRDYEKPLQRSQEGSNVIRDVSCSEREANVTSDDATPDQNLKGNFVQSTKSTVIKTPQQSPTDKKKNIMSFTGQSDKPLSENSCNSVPDSPPHSKTPDRKSSGMILLSFLTSITLCVILMFWLFACVSFGQFPDQNHTANDTNVILSPQEPSIPERRQETTTKIFQTPYRVFVPVDKDKNRVGDYYWIPEQFYEHIRRHIDNKQILSSHWWITEARYQGAVSYNSTNQTLSFFNLKATYKIWLDSNKATVIFPMMPLAPEGGISFDHQSIVPLLLENEEKIVFEIESTPGEHTLELSLTVPSFSNENPQIHINIPKIPNATLELSIPSDAPRINIPDTIGTVNYSNSLLTAKLGAIDHLTFVPTMEIGQRGQTEVNVEQYFLLRARATQTDMKSRFRYEILGGKVQTLAIQMDPQYTFTGNYSCPETEIESVEYDTDNPTLLNVTFKKPVSGNFSLNLDYLVQDFSGIGQIRLPQIKATQAKIINNWFAVSELGNVECGKISEIDIPINTFLNIWENPDPIPVAVYDLQQPDINRLLPIRLKPSTLTVEESLSLSFYSSQVGMKYQAVLKTNGDIFQSCFTVPELFDIDSIELRNSEGTVLESPEYYNHENKLYLIYASPLNGDYQLKIVGRTRSMLDNPFNIPVCIMDQVPVRKSDLWIFRDTSIYLDLTIPENWVNAINDTPNITEQGTQLPNQNNISLLYVDHYILPTERDENTFSNQVSVLIHSNLPKISGTQKAFLFKKMNESWEVVVDFRLNITDGEMDHFEVLLDEFCTQPFSVLEPGITTEIRDYDKNKILVVKPRHAIRDSFNFRIQGKVFSSSENLRFPKISLFKNRSEDYSMVQKNIFLPSWDPTTSTPVQWDFENLIEVPFNKNSMKSDNPSAENLTRLQTAENVINSDRTALSRPAMALSQVANSDPDFPEQIPAIITQSSGMTRLDFQEYTVVSDNYHATTLSSQKTARVIGASHYIYPQDDDTFYGETSMDVFFSKQDKITVILPKSYKLLQITMDGINCQPKQDGDKWTFNMDTRSCTRHLTIIYQGNKFSEKKNRRFFLLKKTFSFARFKVPYLAGIPVNQCYWICSFHSSNMVPTSCRVFQKTMNDIYSGWNKNKKLEMIPTDRTTFNKNNWKTPVNKTEADRFLLKLYLKELDYLLDILEYNSIFLLNQENNDLTRWYTLWLDRWWKVQNNIESLMMSQEILTPLTETQKSAIFRHFNESKAKEILRSMEQENTQGTTEFKNISLDDFFTAKGNALKKYQEIESRHLALIDSLNLRATYESLRPQKSEFESSFLIWKTNHFHHSKYLFGLTNDNLTAVEILVPPQAGKIFSRSTALCVLWFLGTLIALFIIRHQALAEIFIKHIYFWGAAAGIFCFFFLNPPWVGIVVFTAVTLIYWVPRLWPSQRKTR